MVSLIPGHDKTREADEDGLLKSSGGGWGVMDTGQVLKPHAPIVNICFILGQSEPEQGTQLSSVLWRIVKWAWKRRRRRNGNFPDWYINPNVKQALRVVASISLLLAFLHRLLVCPTEHAFLLHHNFPASLYNPAGQYNVSIDEETRPNVSFPTDRSHSPFFFVVFPSIERHGV